MNFGDFWTNLKKILTKLAKFGDNSKFDQNLKFEILNPKIQNLKSLTLKWQNWLKSPKFWRKFLKLAEKCARAKSKMKIVKRDKFRGGEWNPSLERLLDVASLLHDIGGGFVFSVDRLT